MKLNDSCYNFLKWFSLICLPALAVFVSIVLPLPIFNVDPEITKSVVIIINALGALIGALIGVSHITIAQETAQEEFYETDTEDDLPIDEGNTETANEEA